MAAKKPDLDEPTRRIAAFLLNTPPKLHKDMKVVKRKPAKAKAKSQEPKTKGA